MTTYWTGRWPGSYTTTSTTSNSSYIYYNYNPVVDWISQLQSKTPIKEKEINDEDIIAMIEGDD